MRFWLIILLSFWLLAFPTESKADTFYRETFNYCPNPSARPAASAVAGWRAITSKHAEGKPSTLKIQNTGGGTLLPGVMSDPEGPVDGNGYWGRTTPTIGLLLYTGEVNFDIGTLNKVTWLQRVDRQDKPFANYGARAAFLIGGTWYISDRAFPQNTRGVFERRSLTVSRSTYRTTPNTPGIGIVAPTNTGLALPSQGTVTAFGLFFIRSYAKVRIDDFTLVNNAPTGTTPVDHLFERCASVTSDPNTGVDQTPGDDEDNGTTGDDGGSPLGTGNPTPTPTPIPTPTPAPKAQCEDGVDNDGDGQVDAADPGCKNPQDNQEAGGIPPLAPTNLQATDGTSPDQVGVTWLPVTGAHHYRLYRSQFSQQVGDLVADLITDTSFADKSAVPGVTYSYLATAVNEYEDESASSNVDPGFRSSPVIDSDGDGVLDDEEALDNTDPQDQGSFQLHLSSPTFTKYNTYLRQTNFLELAASGTKPIAAAIELHALSGRTIIVENVSIPAKTELDVDINAMLVRGCEQNPSACLGFKDLDGNGVPDTYGVVKILFNDNASDPGAGLTGRMSNYRLNRDGVSYSFAFAKELRNATHGVTFAAANTYDPQNRGFLVPNWLEVSNLDTQPRDFDYLLWNQEGTLVFRRTMAVPALGEMDVEAGHNVLDESGKVIESEYLAEVRPREGATNYFATVSRYSSNAPAGYEPDQYNFAFALDAVPGNGSSQLVPISNLIGSGNECFAQTNWLEVINVREVPVVASVAFRSGNQTINAAVELAPKSQFHFNASALLEKNARGVAEVQSARSARDGEFGVLSPLPRELP